MESSLVTLVIALGIVHGVLPDHGWPIAAAYALNYPRKWFRGTIAALVLGIGHLVSSVALVVAYYGFSRFAAFAEGPYMKPLAGSLLIGLGIYEYASGGHGHDHGGGHNHGGGHDHDHHNHGGGHDHDDHNHDHDDRPNSRAGRANDDGSHDSGYVSRFVDGVRTRLPDGGHAHPTREHAEQGMLTLGVTALVLGFAHEEPVQILAICAGTDRCLELMLVYSIAVIGAILAPTLLLIAGYERHRERIERYTPHLPAITAVVLVTVGLGFVVGAF